MEWLILRFFNNAASTKEVMQCRMKLKDFSDLEGGVCCSF